MRHITSSMTRRWKLVDVINEYDKWWKNQWYSQFTDIQKFVVLPNSIMKQ